MITTEQIKELRASTSLSIMQCKKALEDANGDLEKAMILLKKKSGEIADKKSSRKLGSGVVASYVHSNSSVGSIVSLLCETDFVAKNEEFKTLAYDIAMHITASNPEYLNRKEVTEENIQRAKEVFTKEVEESDKPKEVKEKIIQGKIDSYFKDSVLLEQSFIKDASNTIGDLVKSATQKFGERVEIGEFKRVSI